jgi:HlyD family type I secretion membrane fusion protein
VIVGEAVPPPLPTALARPRAARLPSAIDIPAAPRTRRDIRLGAAITLSFCIGFGLWAWLAPLATATLASGMLIVEGNRRTLQHLEGGIVREFLVRDGDEVKEGAVLIRLDDTQTASTTQALRGIVDGFRALDARLSAERVGADRIDFPADLAERRGEPGVAEIIAGQEAIFVSRRVSLEGQASILTQRVEQLRAEIRSYQAQMRAQEEQLVFIRAEIEDVRGLVDKGLERRPRLLALQRNAAQLVGTRDQQQGLVARAEQQIGEAELQLLQIRNQRLTEVTTEQRDLRSRLAETQERLRAATDVQQRREVVAPFAGVVTNLRFHTVGGVVRPGDPLLDLVPKEEGLVAEVRIQPQDVQHVAVGMKAEVRLTALKQRLVPMVHGEVVYVAADIDLDPRSLASYYRARVRIDADQYGILHGVTLAPGMPADVMVRGSDRNFLAYFTQPIRESFNRAFREY